MLEFIKLIKPPFIRPHPTLWIFILFLNISYIIILSLILFLSDKHYIRHEILHTNLLPEKSYAQDCSLTPENIYNQLDVFVLAHTFGWFSKALILRDYWLLWILSIMFELLEYSLQHQLPNFKECWWDHWILDVLLTNGIGLYMGMQVCRYFQMKHYSWRGLKEIKTYRGKLKRSILQFTPSSYENFNWMSTASLTNFLYSIGLLYLALQCELNAFYLKTLFWIPVEHPINLYRLIFFFLSCLPAVREYYQYLSDSKCKRIGIYAWTTTLCILLEAMIILRFGHDELFTQKTPDYVIYGWTVGITGLVTFVLWRFG